MTREEMLDLVRAVLDCADVPDVLVDITEKRNAVTRFGQNRITQNMDTFQRLLRLTVGDGTCPCSE